MNNTYQVTSIFPCNYFHELRFDMVVYKPNPVWRQTWLGCRVLEVLLDFIRANVSLIYKNSSWYIDNDIREFSKEGLSDFYATPMPLTTEILDYAYPLHPIIRRRFGFVLRRSPTNVMKHFYSQPFTRPVWIWLYTIALVLMLMFYLLRWWENRMIAREGECSLSHEILVVWSGLCQHIQYGRSLLTSTPESFFHTGLEWKCDDVLPIKPILTSRRIAYFTFLLSSYVTYSFYTSNLLSHLVSDRDKAMTLEELVESDYELVVLERTQKIIEMEQYKNDTILKQKMANVEYMNISTGLQAISSGNTALFSDYITLYPYIRKSFDEVLICDLVEIDIYTNIKLYFFTGKHFAYKEQGKISFLRAKETGILKRLMMDSAFGPPRCSFEFPPHAHYTYFMHVMHPVCILLSSYILAVFVMMAERVHYQRNRLWPYVN